MSKCTKRMLTRMQPAGIRQVEVRTYAQHHGSRVCEPIGPWQDGTLDSDLPVIAFPVDPPLHRAVDGHARASCRSCPCGSATFHHPVSRGNSVGAKSYFEP